jgi:hypothetical protein
LRSSGAVFGLIPGHDANTEIVILFGHRAG